MSRNRNPEKPNNSLKGLFLYWIAAGLICLAVLFWNVRARAGEGDDVLQYDIVVLGDSLIGQCQEDTSVTAMMEQRLGCSALNGALGGTGMADFADYTVGNYVTENLSGIALTRAIATGDFGVQKTLRVRSSPMDYFEYIIHLLSHTDYSQVKILLLEYGINDFHAETPIENADDPYDIYTYVGAMRTAIEELQAAYPELRIVLVSPTYAWYRFTGEESATYDLGQGRLEEYVEKQSRIAEEYGLAWVDLYHDLYILGEGEDYYRYTEDGLHPNEYGRGLMADRICEQILTEQ